MAYWVHVMVFGYLYLATTDTNPSNYSNSRALGWDPGSTGRSAAAGCARAGHSIKGFSASTWVSSKAKLVLVIDNEANSEEQSQ